MSYICLVAFASVVCPFAVRVWSTLSLVAFAGGASRKGHPGSKWITVVVVASFVRTLDGRRHRRRTKRWNNVSPNYKEHTHTNRRETQPYIQNLRIPRSRSTNFELVRANASHPVAHHRNAAFLSHQTAFDLRRSQDHVVYKFPFARRRCW